MKQDNYIIKIDGLNFEVWQVGFAGKREIKNNHKRTLIFKKMLKLLLKEHPYLESKRVKKK